MHESLDNKKDILLAEDDHEDVEIFDIALEELKVNYEVRHAENGDKLFILLKEKLPYILFLDIGMPCKDGISCIAEIRRHREYDRLPIIMYTGHRAEMMADRCFSKGADCYIEKTASIRELTDKLKKVFAIDWKYALHKDPKSPFIL